MFVARILHPIKVLGPGDRVGIWFVGCKHGCIGCSNPELWEQLPKYNIDFATFKILIENIKKTKSIDGFTLTGGEPFLQPQVLREILPYLKSISDDILVYSGFTKEELVKLGYADILSEITVLIDGKYQKELNDNSFLKGSSNQTIHILDDKFKYKYEQYLQNGTNQIQNFFSKDSVISVGIHRANYKQELKQSLRQKGLVPVSNK